MRTSQNLRSDQAFGGWGDPSCLLLHLLRFLSQVADLCNIFIIQIRCRDPWIVFFSVKQLPCKICVGEKGRSRNTIERCTLSNTTRGGYEKEGKNFPT